jgi:xanthine/uracil/vitamin C permease (AzgA family)
VQEDGDFPRSRWAFTADAFATMFGSLFGVSPVTSYIESAAGVKAGARTGLTAVLCGLYFLLSIFFAPIIASIPPWATGGALIIVGALMCRCLADIKWYNLTHAMTAFLTVIVMPFTYSIAYGLIAGIGCFVIMEGTFWLLSLVGIKKPEFVPNSEQGGRLEVNEEADNSSREVHPTAKVGVVDEDSHAPDDDDDAAEKSDSHDNHVAEA